MVVAGVVVVAAHVLPNTCAVSIVRPFALGYSATATSLNSFVAAIITNTITPTEQTTATTDAISTAAAGTNSVSAGTTNTDFQITIPAESRGDTSDTCNDISSCNSSAGNIARRDVCC